MRKSLFVMVFNLVLVAVSAPLAADSLFSRVRVDSVFSPSTNDSQPRPAPRISPSAPQKVTGIGQLSELLREAGFDTEEVGSRVVSTEKELADRSFPVLVSISDDEGQLEVVLLLAKVTDAAQLSAEKLLNLMNANKKYAPAYFAYSSERKRTELHRVVENQAMTSRLLKDEINRLANIAQETDNLWQIEAPQAASPSSPPPAATQPSAPATSLVGKWSAARSAKEAFAILFKADGKFVLVYVSQGKQTRSDGNYTLSGQSLTLQGKGLRLSGTISKQSAKQFHLLLENTTSSLVFKRA